MAKIGKRPNAGQNRVAAFRAQAADVHKRQAIAKREGLKAYEDGGYTERRTYGNGRPMTGRTKPKFVFGRRVM